MVAIALVATLAVVLGAWTETPVVVAALPIMGLAMASMDALSRTMLQRSSDPRQLGPLFVALGFIAGLGQLAGSVVAQVAMALGGPRASLVTLGGLLVVLATVSLRSLRRADAYSEVPVMEMTLLSGIPVFSSLPTVGDPALTGAVLNSEFVCLWEPATLKRRRQIAAELTEIAVGTGDAEMEFLGGFFAAYCVAESGQLVEARDQLVALRPVLERSRIEFFEFLAERLIISIDIARGEPDVKDRIDALAQRHAHTRADTDGAA